MLNVLLTIVGYRQRFLGVNVPHLGCLKAEMESRYNFDLGCFKLNYNNNSVGIASLNLTRVPEYLYRFSYWLGGKGITAPNRLGLAMVKMKIYRHDMLTNKSLDLIAVVQNTRLLKRHVCISILPLTIPTRGLFVTIKSFL